LVDQRSPIRSGDFLAHFCFSNLSEFPIIPISGKDYAAAASTGGRMPMVARVNPSIMYEVVKTRLPFTTRIHLWAIFNTSGTRIQYSRIRAIYAASMATSEPTVPIAIPISARASVCALFTPSPTIIPYSVVLSRLRSYSQVARLLVKETPSFSANVEEVRLLFAQMTQKSQVFPQPSPTYLPMNDSRRTCTIDSAKV